VLPSSALFTVASFPLRNNSSENQQNDDFELKKKQNKNKKQLTATKK
jgi:hypothetical protein